MNETDRTSNLSTSAASTGSALYFRQISNSYVTDGVVGLFAFRPMKHDDRKLSVATSEVLSAEESLRAVESSGGSSIGVQGLDEREIGCAFKKAQGDEHEKIAGSAVRDDIGFQGHCHIDFKDLTKSQCKCVAAALASAAASRGWLYKPPTDGVKAS